MQKEVWIMSGSVMSIQTKPVRGLVTELPGWDKSSERSQMVCVLVDFGYTVKAIARVIGASVEAVQADLDAIDPDGRVRVTLGRKISQWSELRQRALDALTPEKMQEADAGTLMKIAASSEMRGEQLRATAAGKQKALSEGELKQNVLKELGQGEEK